MNILITTCLNPILDAVAACYAYWKLRLLFKEQVTIGIEGQEDIQTQWLLRQLHISDIVRLEEQPSVYDVFILWNVVRDRALQPLPKAVDNKRIIEINDSGSPNKFDYSDFEKALVSVEPVALSTMVTERYKARRLPMDPTTVQLLYSAIYVATNNLEPGKTTPRDRDALRYLQTQMTVPLALVRDLFVATQPH